MRFMYLSMKGNVRKIRSKWRLTVLSLLALCMGTSIIVFFGIAPMSLLFAEETEFQGYFVSDVQCLSYRPSRIEVDGYSLKFDSSSCAQISKLDERLPLSIKVIDSGYYGILTGLDIDGYTVIDSSYSYKYYYAQAFIGLLWSIVGSILIFAGSLYVGQLRYLLKLRYY